jgi:hypothetical protein
LDSWGFASSWLRNYLCVVKRFDHRRMDESSWLLQSQLAALFLLYSRKFHVCWVLCSYMQCHITENLLRDSQTLLDQCIKPVRKEPNLYGQKNAGKA